jgi:hypothetical protein
MGHIREPKGVDFIIKSEPLTESARKEISETIRKYKNKSALKSIQKKVQIQKSE